jgi:predicted phage-related endonuclease
MIKTLGYNPNSFAVALEYNGNKKIQRLIGTDSKPSVDMLIDIKKKFININIEWLITGEGDMLQNAATFSVITKKIHPMPGRKRQS